MAEGCESAVRDARGGGQTRESRRAATRQSILDAAVEAFSRWGFEGTHFREITRLCGAQRSLILYHFSSKDVLWQCAAEEVERRFTAAFEVNFAPEHCSGDRDLVRHALACFVDALCEVPEYGRIYLLEGVSAGPRMEWLARHFAPRRALKMELQDKALQKRIRTTVLRDVLSSALVAFVTLGPLLERSHALAAGQPAVGVHPLSAEQREEFVAHLMKLIF